MFSLILAVLLGVSLLAGLGRATADSTGAGFDGDGRIVIRNASLVLTMDPELGEGPLGLLADADVLIDRDRIGAVGKDLPDDGARVLDGHGKIVLPGFVDLHNHLWQALIRGCGTDQELNGWLSGCVLPLSGPSISSADGYAGARLATLDVISSGVTTVTDWSHAFNADFARGNLRALEDSRLRFVNHTVQMTDAELDELAAHDVRVAHNPLSNMRLASGIARVPDMRARNIKVGLGLDGGTNDNSDMFANMKAAVGLQRAVSHDPTRFPTPLDVLRMATLGGAEVLGLDGETGSLTPGKQADVQLINPATVNFAPEFDWISQLVFNAQPANVEWVFVSGRALKRDGRIVGDQGPVIAEAQAASDRVQKLLGRDAHPGGR